MDSSKITPMFLAEVEGGMLTSATATFRISGRQRCLALNTRSYVLFLFNFSLLQSIHTSISLAQASILETAAAVSSGV